MRKFIITEDVLLAVLNYLYAKPYIEVRDLLKNLESKTELIKETEEEKT